MRIEIKHNFAEVIKRIEAEQKQREFATVVALNRAAYAGAQAAKAGMRKAFDKPTPWVLGGVRYIKATKARPVSQVDLDFWGNKQQVAVDQVLYAEIRGGPRKMKRHEVALQRAGILPPGMFAVPGAAAQLDAYGNMVSGQIVQIISWFKGFGEQGYKANATDASRRRLAKGSKRTGAQGFEYFALAKPHGKLPPGIYQRFTFAQGSAVKPVMIFVPQPKYRVRFPMRKVVLDAALAEFKRQYPIAVAEAMRTAR